MSGTDMKDPEGSKKLTKVDRDQVRQTFSHGRSKTVEVEIRRRRTGSPARAGGSGGRSSKLTNEELEGRMKALQNAILQKEKEEETKPIPPLMPTARPFEVKPRLKTGVIEAPPSAYEKREKEAKRAREEELIKEKEARKEERGRATQRHKDELQKTEDRSRTDRRRDSRPQTEFVSRERRREPRTDSAPPRTQDQTSPQRTDRPRPYRPERPQGDRPQGSSDRPQGDRQRKPYAPSDRPRGPRPTSTPGSRPQSPGDRPQRPYGGGAERQPRVDGPGAPVVFHADDFNKTPKKRVAQPKKNIEKAKTDVKKQNTPRKTEGETRLTKRVINRVLDTGDLGHKERSHAALKRAREKQKTQLKDNQEVLKVIREVIIPDTILVGELANRMAVRSADVIKTLMRLGVMVTVNQVIDADTAELICGEFGHKSKRVSEGSIEEKLISEDAEDTLLPRAPVVTIMGHVDHGKTSLLDALRQTDVVSGEAGGITQHIGAYQVTLQSDDKITFIDTPGHAAFTQMRARGAHVTDVVVLVVAADDGIKEQTIEAIHHAQAAKVPIIVAINKIDKPDSDPQRVRNELLSHNIVVEEFGGDIIAVDVSAKKKLNLDKLEEAILLQAEILDLKANPHRQATGIVVEARMDKGRGVISTLLVQKGTLQVGDAFVAGSQWGRVRALVDDHGRKVQHALPSMPVEILGFNGMPVAGDTFAVVENEQKAREIAEYREGKEREKRNVASARSSLEKMMDRIAAGDVRELSLVVKTDVHGSLEAITSSLAKLTHEEVAVRILHGGVGSINESDVILARASTGIVIGFNVRANPQARDLARRDNVEIRYYSIIYNILDDMKGLLTGMLAPTMREKALGIAEIRQVFSSSKIGKVAGCYVTEGLVKRGARIRLLRDNVVIHEGDLKTLRRFKEEAKEVKENYECGIVLDYQDIREGDLIECYEMEAVKREL